MRHAAPGLTPGLRIRMHIVVEKKAFLGRARNSEHRIPARNALQSEKCADFFPRLGSLGASRRCSRFSLPFVLRSRRRFHHPGRGRLRAHRPSPPAWPPPRPRKRGAKTTRIFTEYFPETPRRAPPEYFSNTARRPPENPREYFANTSRILPGHLPGHFGFVCDSFSGELFEKYSGGFRATIRASFRVFFRVCFRAVVGGYSRGIRGCPGGIREGFGWYSGGLPASHAGPRWGPGGRAFAAGSGQGALRPQRGLRNTMARCQGPAMGLRHGGTATNIRDVCSAGFSHLSVPFDLSSSSRLRFLLVFPFVVPLVFPSGFPVSCRCLPFCVSCLSSLLWFPLSFLRCSLCLVFGLPFCVS